MPPLLMLHVNLTPTLVWLGLQPSVHESTVHKVVVYLAQNMVFPSLEAETIEFESGMLEFFLK